MKDRTKRKFESIKSRLAGRNVLVAFSGGVDSTVLASIVSEVANRKALILISSPTISEREMIDAREIARDLSLDLFVKQFNWLDNKELSANDVDRCFKCKQILADLWINTARELDFDTVVEGTNASESAGYRPGLKALKNTTVQSPFLDTAVTKEEIREYAREKGLSVAGKPSVACLVTRFPYGTEITSERLRMVENVENAVSEIFGVECVRARYHGNLVRIEVAASELSCLFDLVKLKQLDERARHAGFSYVTLDLRGYRTGSMDEELNL